MKWSRLTALALLASLTVQADTFTIRWTPPTARTDGTPITEAEFSKYTLYCDGNALVDLGVVPGFWEAEITIDPQGTYSCGLTVSDLQGQESELSNQLDFVVGPHRPGPVTDLQIIRQVP